jgi:hypothetical protein
MARKTTTTDPAPELFLWIRPLPDDLAWQQRVKRALKFLLRSCQLKARAWAHDLEELPEGWKEIEPEK